MGIVVMFTHTLISIRLTPTAPRYKLPTGKLIKSLDDIENGDLLVAAPLQAFKRVAYVAPPPHVDSDALVSIACWCAHPFLLCESNACCWHQ
jgi:hypothetical protein